MMSHLMPTGPANPTGAPVTVWIVCSSASSIVLAPRARRILFSFASWSPRISTATGLPSALKIKVLIILCGLHLRTLHTASMLPALGVAISVMGFMSAGGVAVPDRLRPVSALDVHVVAAVALKDRVLAITRGDHKLV